MNRLERWFRIHVLRQRVLVGEIHLLSVAGDVVGVEQMEMLQRGKRLVNTKSVTFKDPGTYEYYCNVPGHKQAGMVGTLTVE